MHEAKTQLSRLVERVEAGEEVIIGRGGKPVARLIPFRPAGAARTPGALKGRLWIAADFDETPASIIAAFEGDE